MPAIRTSRSSPLRLSRKRAAVRVFFASLVAMIVTTIHDYVFAVAPL
jgi:hypothetical protein